VRQPNLDESSCPVQKLKANRLKNSKEQTPKLKHQDPNTKHQKNTKIQTFGRSCTDEADGPGSDKIMLLRPGRFGNGRGAVFGPKGFGLVRLGSDRFGRMASEERLAVRYGSDWLGGAVCRVGRDRSAGVARSE
jgi:hypothetical protein